MSFLRTLRLAAATVAVAAGIAGFATVDAPAPVGGVGVETAPLLRS
jgi:hypothetical protein